MHTKWPFAWQTARHHLSWWQFALCIGVMGLWLAISQTEGAERNFLITAVRTAEILVPLFAGMQAAYAFSPEDEGPLEIMLAAPRPILWVIAERLILILAGYGAIGLTAILLIQTTFAVGDATISTMLVRWLPPMVWFIGVGLYLTLVTRQGMFGALMVLVIWGTSLLSSGGVPEKYLAIAPILPYLQQGAPNISDDLYTLNRITLIVTGFLLAGAAARLALDEERVLGIKKRRFGIGDWRLFKQNTLISNLQPRSVPISPKKESL
jgi:hypothetical protein